MYTYTYVYIYIYPHIYLSLSIIYIYINSNNYTHTEIRIEIIETNIGSSRMWFEDVVLDSNTYLPYSTLSANSVK